MKIEEERNVHKLLRIVWVYLDHGGEGSGVDLGELPIELAADMTGIPIKELNEHDNLEAKPDRPLKYEDVKKALDRLYELFREGDFDIKLPWPNSNPCPGARPKYRV